MQLLRRTATAACVMAMLATGTGGLAVHAAAAADSVSLSFGIYDGSCFNLTGKPIYKLEKLTRKSAAVIRALPAYSDSTVDASLESLQTNTHSLVVTRDGKLDSVLACGEINNAPLADGTITIGLRDINGTTYAGVALLTSDGNQTQVRAYVAPGLSAGLSAEADDGDGEVTADSVAVVTVDDMEITSDQTTFHVGSTIEFMVTNQGTEPHEVMIEPLGGNEQPFANADGSQAETEDIAPDESASFVYSFDKPGTYQFADHIGDDSQVLQITVEQQ